MLGGQQLQPFVAQQEHHQQPQPFVSQAYNTHEYRVAINGNDRGKVELGTASPAELHGGAGVAEGEPQQIDGYVAPATMGHDGRAVEMPAQPVQGAEK